MTTETNDKLVKIKAGRPIDQAIISAEPEQVARRLKMMIIGGKKLNNEEALALATYCIGTGLNPFLGEAWYLPNIGPGPGIAGWRRKASEQLWYEAEQARMPAAFFWCDFRPANEGEADFDPDKGDIAYVAILHDTINRTMWEQKILGHLIQLDVKKVGKDHKERLEIARALAGDEPTWSAVGVVHGSEVFSGDEWKDGKKTGEKKPEMWDRHERCKKRAEKGAIRKRFNLYIPEPLGFDVVEADFQVLDEPEEDRPRLSEAEIIASLYNEKAPEPEQEPEPETSTVPKDDMDWEAFYKFAEIYISRADAELIAKEAKSAVKAFKVLEKQVESQS